jgi:hypothetical protein
MHVAGVLVVLRLVYDPVRRRAEPSTTPVAGGAVKISRQLVGLKTEGLA